MAKASSVAELLNTAQDSLAACERCAGGLWKLMLQDPDSHFVDLTQCVDVLLTASQVRGAAWGGAAHKHTKKTCCCPTVATASCGALSVSNPPSLSLLLHMLLLPKQLTPVCRSPRTSACASSCLPALCQRRQQTARRRQQWLRNCSNTRAGTAYVNTGECY